ncbi:MAG TPA: glycosyltransferase family 2 protein [Candidatus Acidoferrales bacterium]|nr:glycosyltransferase family 2 protein [Candidatus Acidoferrales bacterium]
MDSAQGQPITAVLPARNEEGVIEAAVRSLAAQPEIAEIRVVNDSSADRTGEILSRLAAELPQLRVLESAGLPAGWVGKNHAAWLGAEGVGTAWLLFTDADVRHLPGSAGRALARADSTGAGLVSFSPRQRMETGWERAIIPFVFLRLAARFSYDRVNDPQAADAAANGQYLLIRREAYQAIGGHRSVAGEVLEDVALARRAKRAGIRIHFASGAEFAETRMYTNFRSMWQGWTKILYPLMGGTPLAAADELLRVIPIGALALFALSLFYPLAAAPAAVLLFVRLWRYAMDLRRHRFPVRGIVYWGPGLALYAAALVVSARRYSEGSVVWKGRTYPVRPNPKGDRPEIPWST